MTLIPISSRFNRLWLGLFLVALCQGCGESDVPLGTVEGMVTMDGNPLPDATLRFRPIAGGRNALGRTDQEGHYEMLYSATANGALVGEMRVEITVAEEEELPNGRTVMKPELVPEKYNVKSELTAEVVPGGSLIDFHLMSE